MYMCMCKYTEHVVLDEKTTDVHVHVSAWDILSAVGQTTHVVYTCVHV